MKLHDFIHASTRPSWTARLVVYLAVMVTLIVAVEVATLIWLT